MTSSDTIPSGEERLKSRRRSFWRFLALGMIAALAAGFFSGYFTSSYEEGALPLWVPLLMLAVSVIGLIWFTRDYFRRVDELDLMDNLWAHLIGQYIAAIVFLIWYVVADLGLTSHPTAIAIVIVLLGGTFAVYGLRKLGLR